MNQTNQMPGNKNGASGPPIDNDLLEVLKLERESIGDTTFPNAARLLDKEIEQVSRGKLSDFLDVTSDSKKCKLNSKVYIPHKEFPKFNFVGKLLGPKGLSLKRLQEDTGTKMSILGKGSMRDKNKEEECRKEGGKYAHLNEELHVLVEVFAPPAEAYSRLSHAMAELRKYLTPEYNDEIRQEQFQELMNLGDPGSAGAPRGRGGRGRGMPGGPAPRGRGAMGGGPMGRGSALGRGGIPAGRGASRGGLLSGRGAMGGGMVPPPAPTPLVGRGALAREPDYDDGYGAGYDDAYGESSYSAGGRDAYEEDYSAGGASDTQYFDYGHGSTATRDRYDDAGYGDSWGSGSLGGGRGSGSTYKAPTSLRAAPRQHPYGRGY
ncbi:KH domain-containing, RNA-binding, signal transduction-associated protein 3 [Lingula anatina]|uniref:KH domain-containing, RNA-binding, signal transduction-associated protein 3 n=1 Tax=Lingula anatina TaxID=7574 RepID=A0A1S3JBK2_LINAN|nr:KH domain-containing, RNA-binding, signal transduction-associated protein 3 [Lingula anatina]|eukprot:XP_013407264.1 KH domain-containing, RNA-binding, signal transduction-associated protein 3 [Lingula anatina]